MNSEKRNEARREPLIVNGYRVPTAEELLAEFYAMKKSEAAKRKVEEEAVRKRTVEEDTAAQAKEHAEWLEQKLRQRWQEQELIRRQQVIDAAWQRTLNAKRELEVEHGYHRGPGDPDWRQ